MRRSVAAALALTLVSPLALLLWLLLAPEPRAPQGDHDPVWTAAVLREERTSFRARLEVTSGDGGKLVYQGSPGTITAVHTAPGRALRTGDAVVDVDGVTRLAFHADVPLHRDLGPGDTGADVAALQVFLQQVGEDVEHDGRYGPGTTTAVRRLAGSLGVDRPDGTFARGWLVWLESDEVAVAALQCRLADAVEQGGELATTAAPVVGAALTHPSGEPLELPHVGPWRLLLGDDEAGVFRRTSEIAHLSAVERAAGAQPPPQTIVLDAVVEEAAPASVIAVPSGAVHVRADGRACVVLETVGGDQPAEVTLGSRGAFGDVQVVHGLEPGDRVLLDPPDLLAQRCS